MRVVVTGMVGSRSMHVATTTTTTISISSVVVAVVLLLVIVVVVMVSDVYLLSALEGMVVARHVGHDGALISLGGVHQI